MEKIPRRAHIMVGPPGSGKSTFATKLRDATWASGEQITYISTDKIRLQLFDNLTDPEIYTKENHSKVFYKALELMEMSKTTQIIHDATNLSRKRRKELYRRFKRYGMEVIIHVFIEPFNTIGHRVLSRKDRLIDLNVVLGMYHRTQPPKVGVDCDGYIIHSTNPIKNGDYELLDGLLRINEAYKKDFVNIKKPHHSKHHLEAIDEHIKMCVDNVVKSDYDIETKEILYNVALFHDLGKSATKNKGTYYNHENVSAMYALSYFVEHQKIIRENDIVVEAVLYHMLAHNGISDKVINNYNIIEEELRIINLFKAIDEKSRIVKEKSDETKNA